MSTAGACAYLGKLLNRPTTADELVFLSSAQQARFHAWLTANKIAFKDGAFDRRFRLQDLLESPSVEVARATPAHSRAGQIDNMSGQIGVDIQRIAELFPGEMSDDLKSSNELREIFTLKELSYAQTKSVPLDTLAGLFAAKEAALKCSEWVDRLPLTQFEILPDSAGRPSLSGFRISISHSGEYAVAVAQRTSEPDNGAKAPGLREPVPTTNLNSDASKGSRIRILEIVNLVLILLLALFVLFKHALNN